MGDKQVYTPHKSKLLTNPTYYHESAVKLQKIPLNLPEPRRSERLNPTTPKETNIGGQSTSSGTITKPTTKKTTTTMSSSTSSQTSHPSNMPEVIRNMPPYSLEIPEYIQEIIAKRKEGKEALNEEENDELISFYTKQSLQLMDKVNDSIQLVKKVAETNPELFEREYSPPHSPRETMSSPISGFQERSKTLKFAIEMIKTTISPFEPKKQEWTSWLAEFDRAAEEKEIPDYVMTDVFIAMLNNAPEYKEYIRQNKICDEKFSNINTNWML